MLIVSIIAFQVSTNTSSLFNSSALKTITPSSQTTLKRSFNSTVDTDNSSISQPKVWPKSKKIATLKAVKDELQQKNLIDNELYDFLCVVVGPKQNLIAPYLLSRITKGMPKAYEPKIRAFALNLNFFSPKAYKYVRDTFNNCLPHPRIITSWYTHVNYNPGFTSESFTAIERAVAEAKKQSQTLCVNIVFDEIAVSQQNEWDKQNSYGYVYDGDGGIGNSPAKHLLVFMVVCVNSRWKIPVAYFPITSLSAEQRANMIVHCFENLLKTGVEIVGVTFDGSATNFSAMHCLGCSLTEVKDEYSFRLELLASKFLIYTDPCQMIKLVRNAFGDLGVFYDGYGNKIEWKYLQLLLDLQPQVHLSEQLQKTYIEFTHNKMNIRFAVQTMSKSVAHAIDFCREELKMPEFTKSLPTSCFLTNLNDIFDVLNSRNINEIGYKKALCSQNYKEISNFAKKNDRLCV